MAVNTFTGEEVNELQKNPYVKKASEKAITYTDEFKEHFIEEYRKGKLPTQILREAGFDTRVLGERRVSNLSRRYRAMAERPEGLTDTRKGHSGRPSTRDLTPEEEIQRLKQKVKYLEQENAFLKKIEFLDKRARQKQSRKTNTKS